VSDLEFIADTKVRSQLGVSEMSVWRWDHDPSMAPPGWPARVKIGRRNYRNREQFEAFKARLMRVAIQARQTRGRAEAAATA
jgi:hypothetical protein